MTRIAILGTENSHALAFAKRLLKPEFSDLQLVGIYGYDAAANNAIVEIHPGIEVAETPDAFLGKVDGVIVTARHGTHHYEYGLPYAKAGLPCFIDKPFTVEGAHAKEMIEAAKASGSLLCGGSCLKFAPALQEMKALLQTPPEGAGKLFHAAFSAPIDLENPYGGFFFYSQHLVQMVLTVFGCRVQSVIAKKREDSITVIFRYPEADVTGVYGVGSYNAYGGSLYFQTKLCHFECPVTEDMFDKELLEYAELVRTGKMEESYEELIYPVTLLQAIFTSMNTNTEVFLK